MAHSKFSIKLAVDIINECVLHSVDLVSYDCEMLVYLDFAGNSVYQNGTHNAKKRLNFVFLLLHN